MTPLTLAEVQALSRDPAAREAFGGDAAPALLVDLSGAVPDAAALGAWLSDLPAPVIGLGADDHPLASSCDVLASEARHAARLVKGAAKSPQAAAILVQLLRATETMAPAGALNLESLAYATLQGGPEFAAWRSAYAGAGPTKSRTGEAVRLVRDGARLEIVLARPDERNAIGVEMRDALVEALGVAAADEAIADVALRGEGRCFSVGGDLAEFGQTPDPASAHRIRSLRLPARAALACASRLQARVHGACIGAGVEIAAFAGRVVAREDAFFQLPELGFGLIPGAGGTVSLPRRIGRQRTVEMALTGRRIPARVALAWGLVDTVED